MRMIFYLITVLWKVCLSEALEIESNETVLIKENIEGDHGLEKYANMTNVDHFITHKPLISEESVDDQDS